MEHELFRYIIASGEMRFIERTERVLLLVDDPRLGWLVRGVIPGCGSTCDANLAQVILEFIMSCEGLDEETADSALRLFAHKNAANIVAHIKQEHPAASLTDLFELTLSCLIRSLGGSLVVKAEGKHYSGDFDGCPLCSEMAESGLTRGGEDAHKVVADLARALVHKLDPSANVKIPDRHTQTDHELSVEVIRTIG
jgi:hypothetical protein